MAIIAVPPALKTHPPPRSTRSHALQADNKVSLS
jgi:hypothetical protein